jgi:S23 ribosomal protein.
MRIERFEDVVAWQKGIELAVSIYETFGTLKDYGFRDQIQRAVISITNNIAEGFERQSNVEFKRFLYYSKGSCGEVRSMLIVANKLQIIDQNQCNNLTNNCNEISKIIAGLIKSL